MGIEERATEILDKLTADVKIEDAAVMVAGFYAGMNGYTPLSAIMKMTIVGSTDDKNLQDAALRSVFGIPGLAIASVFKLLTPEEKQEAAANGIVPLDRMDPRKVNVDYLYERLFYLKELQRTAAARIETHQSLIDKWNSDIIYHQTALASFQSKLAEGFSEQAFMDKLLWLIDQCKIAIARLEAAIKEEQASGSPRPDYIATLRQNIADQYSAMADYKFQYDRLTDDRAIWASDLNGKIKSEQDQIAWLRTQIDQKKQIIENIKEELASSSKEIEIIERKFLELKLSLGMVGLIEAYTITRIGIGEILKGIGEIVPL